jgi:PPOX class probable F420-dependent enzyme
MKASITSSAPEELAELDRHKYLSLVTYRRDGRGVTTPVWFVTEGGRLFVYTEEATGKAKRLRRDPHLMAAPCTASGRPRGRSFEAVAEVASPGEEPHLEALFDRKYRFAKLVMTWAAEALRRLRGRSAGRGIYLAITPIGIERT